MHLFGVDLREVGEGRCRRLAGADTISRARRKRKPQDPQCKSLLDPLLRLLCLRRAIAHGTKIPRQVRAVLSSSGHPPRPETLCHLWMPRSSSGVTARVSS